MFFVFLYYFEVNNFLFRDIKFVLSAAVTTIILFVISLIIASDEKINPFLLLFTPLYDLLEKLFHPKSYKPAVYKKINSEMLTPISNGIEVSVSDGKNIIKCLLELKNTSNGFQTVFRYKTKTLTSSVYESPKKAIDEISDKLIENGLKLIICSSCSHFGKKPNSPLTSQDGLCSQKDKMTDDIQPETFLLNSCAFFQHTSDLNNVVDFSKEKDIKNNNNEIND